MAREIASRLLIKGTMTAQTPLHVGGYGTSPDTDLPLAQNGRGEWYVPGTSLTGVIRSWCERSWPEDDRIAKLFGPSMKRGYEVSGHASFVLIEDAVVSMSGNPIEIRDGVGIDRVWGTAAEGIKFDRAILPRGSQFVLEMTVEIAARKSDETKEEFRQREGQTKSLIGHLLTALQHEELRFGAARTRGLGRVKLEPQEPIEQTLNNRDGILKALRGEGTTRTIDDLQKASSAMDPRKLPRLDVEIKWRPKGPLMVKAGYEGVGVDSLPLVSGVYDGVALVLPGSSIKGALRSQGERIVRTLRDIEAPDFPDSRERFLKQLDDDRLKLVHSVFGARNKPRQDDTSVDKNGPIPGLGALSVDDCYASTSMDRDAWRVVERATAQPDDDSREWELRKAIDPALDPPLDDQRRATGAATLEEARAGFAAIKNQGFEISHHVAIDRWTGGASDGALFSVLAPQDVEWQEMRITVDLMRIPKAEWQACIALLFFVLRDLMQNRIPLGFGVNRGMGEVEIEQIHLHTTLRDFPESITLRPPKEGESHRKLFHEFDQDLLKRLSGEWQRALEIKRDTSTPIENGGLA